MNPIKNQKGVSLVEMVVSSTLSLVIGGVIYTVFSMYNQQSKASIASLMMHQQYDNVARQIAKDVRMASYVLGPDETPVNHAAGPDTVTSIAICDNNGTPIAQYAIRGRNLTEGAQQSDFQSGGAVVTVVEGASNFILDPQRRSVIVNLSLERSDMGPVTQTISSRKDLFLCRN